MTRPEFVQLCRELREIGATEVIAEGFHARFAPAQTVVAAKLTPRLERELESHDPAKSKEAEREYIRNLLTSP